MRFCSTPSYRLPSFYLHVDRLTYHFVNEKLQSLTFPFADEANREILGHETENNNHMSLY